MVWDRHGVIEFLIDQIGELFIRGCAVTINQDKVPLGITVASVEMKRNKAITIFASRSNLIELHLGAVFNNLHRCPQGLQPLADQIRLSPGGIEFIDVEARVHRPRIHGTFTSLTVAGVKDDASTGQNSHGTLPLDYLLMICRYRDKREDFARPLQSVMSLRVAAPLAMRTATA